jgi:DnaK suppressor protein
VTRGVKIIDNAGWGSIIASPRVRPPQALENAVKKKDLERFRKLLASERNRILQNAIHMADRNVTIDADDVPDIVDLATSDLSLNLNVEIRERERHLLGKIDVALAKIDDGSFGICDDCGEAIAPRRLEARPVTTLCIKCKEEEEELEKRGGARREPEDLRFPLKPIVNDN